MEKNEMREAHLDLRKACKDMVCAVRDNPNAFRHVRVNNQPPIIDTSHARYIGNVGIFGAIGAFCTKLYLVLGGHI